jgi:hypothetical protein
MSIGQAQGLHLNQTTDVFISNAHESACEAAHALLDTLRQVGVGAYLEIKNGGE